MVEIFIDTTEAERQLKEAEALVIKASDAGIVAIADFVLPHMRASLSGGMLGSRTGQLVEQLTPKMFKQRDGFMGAAVKIKNEPRREMYKGRNLYSSVIVKFHEYGTKSHGRPNFDTKGLNRQRRRSLMALQGTSALPARHMFAKTWQAIEGQAIDVFMRTFDQNFKPTQSQ